MIMSSQAWPIIGVVVGAILAGGAQVLHALLQRRWTKQDSDTTWNRQREARLFDFKRLALTDFLAEVERAHASLSDYEIHPDGPPRQASDFFYLWNHQSPVAVYGSKAVASSARDVVLMFAQLVDSHGDGVVPAVERYQGCVHCRGTCRHRRRRSRRIVTKVDALPGLRCRGSICRLQLAEW